MLIVVMMRPRPMWEEGGKRNMAGMDFYSFLFQDIDQLFTKNSSPLSKSVVPSTVGGFSKCQEQTCVQKLASLFGIGSDFDNTNYHLTRRNLCIRAYHFAMKYCEDHPMGSEFQLLVLDAIGCLRKFNPVYANPDSCPDWYLPPEGIKDIKMWVGCLHVGYPRNYFVHYLDRWVSALPDALPLGLSIDITSPNWSILNDTSGMVYQTQKLKHRLYPLTLSKSDELNYKARVTLTKYIPSWSAILKTGLVLAAVYVAVIKPLTGIIFPKIPGLFQFR